VSGAGADLAGAAHRLPVKWLAVGMREGCGGLCRRVAEHVIEEAQEALEALWSKREHMFARLGRGSDGTGVLQRILQAPRASGRSYRAGRTRGRALAARRLHAHAGARIAPAVGVAGRSQRTVCAPGSSHRAGRTRGRALTARGPSSAETQSADHTSSFVRTRSITASVNSVVPEWPPRSGVRVPEATASSAAS
jgi:hypothetical protein